MTSRITPRFPLSERLLLLIGLEAFQVTQSFEVLLERADAISVIFDAAHLEKAVEFEAI